MIEIARFADVYEAEIAASRLNAEGYNPVLGGAEHAKTNTLALLALGGVSLSVPNDQAQGARLLLDRLREGAGRIEDAEPVDDGPARRVGTALLICAVLVGILLVLKGWDQPPLLHVPVPVIDHW